MTEYTHSLDIYAPPEVVWKRAVDEMVFAMAKNSISMEPKGDIQTGTRFEGAAQVLGRRAIIAGSVSDYQCYQSMAVELDVERSNLPCKPQAASTNWLTQTIMLTASSALQPTSSTIALIALIATAMR